MFKERGYLIEQDDWDGNGIEGGGEDDDNDAELGRGAQTLCLFLFVKRLR